MMGNWRLVVYPEAVTQDADAAPQPAAGRDLIEQGLARMRAHGARATPARRLLLGALVENPGHSSAEELAACVQARAPDVNLSTIYRNLDELERLNVVDRTRLGYGPATYHLASAHPWPPRLRTVQLDDRSPGRDLRRPHRNSPVPLRIHRRAAPLRCNRPVLCMP